MPHRAPPAAGRRHFSRCLPAALLAVLLSIGCLPYPQSISGDLVIDTDDVDALLDRYTHSRRDYGCGMELMTASEESYAGFRDVIAGARTAIDIETLDFDDDLRYGQDGEDISLEFAELLVEQAGRGVRVRVILDWLTHALISRPGINDVLVTGGVDVREFRPDRAELSTGNLLFRMHKKILIADGQRAIVGGSNYGYRYQGPAQWRDTNALLTGPIVTTLQREFDTDWDRRTGPAHLQMSSPAPAPPAGDLVLRAIDQKPSEDDFDINEAVRIGLRVARTRVDIEAPYFNPTDWLLAELSDAVSRGVQVRVLMNSEDSVDMPQVFYSDASRFEVVLQRGVRLLLWDGTAETMHSKAMVVDDRLAMVGTYNFNARSILWDTENAVFTTDPAAVRMIDEMIGQDLETPGVREIDLEWVRSQSPCDRATWQLYGLLAPLF